VKSDHKKGILNPTRDGKTNILGGGNINSLYVPISEDEQEVIHRLVEAGDLQLIVHDFGKEDKPHIIVGDLRVGIQFQLNIPVGMLPRTVTFLDLELRRHNGQTVFREKKALSVNGEGIIVQGGMFLDFQWDIAIHSMDPEFVRAIKPGATGLTSRRIDRDTGERTHAGNMNLDSVQKGALAYVEKGAAEVRAEDALAVAKAVKDSE